MADPSVLRDRLAPYWGLIQDAANRYGIDPYLLAGLIYYESGGNPRARSAAGAVGLGQVMPREAGFPGRPSAEELLDPATNIDWSARILADRYQRYKSWDKAVAAYLGAVDAQGNIRGGDPYTGVSGQQYVRNVFTHAQTARSAFRKGTMAEQDDIYQPLSTSSDNRAEGDSGDSAVRDLLESLKAQERDILDTIASIEREIEDRKARLKPLQDALAVASAAARSDPDANRRENAKKTAEILRREIEKIGGTEDLQKQLAAARKELTAIRGQIVSVTKTVQQAEKRPNVQSYERETPGGGKERVFYDPSTSEPIRTEVTGYPKPEKGTKVETFERYRPDGTKEKVFYNPETTEVLRVEPLGTDPSNQPSLSYYDRWNAEGQKERVWYNPKTAEPVRVEPLGVDPAEERRKLAEEAALEAQRLANQIRRREIDLKEAEARYNQWWKLNVDLPLQALKKQEERMAANRAMADAAAAYERERLKMAREAGEKRVQRELALMPYRVGPTWNEDFTRALNAIANREPGGITFRPESFRFKMPDLDQLAEQETAKVLSQISPYAQILQQYNVSPLPAFSPDDYIKQIREAAAPYMFSAPDTTPAGAAPGIPPAAPPPATAALPASEDEEEDLYYYPARALSPV